MQLHNLDLRPGALMIVRLDLEVSPLAHSEAYPETKLTPCCGNSITDFIRGVDHTSSTPQIEDPTIPRTFTSAIASLTLAAARKAASYTAVTLISGTRDIRGTHGIVSVVEHERRIVEA
ncbi:hypothetical protein FIE12Z_5633 [Fusarium flagelliforme]|uniref:Uncharacterized protein n=1 Tax=Fusarium flagelliforme TaxID=2675880 RepID=A0A395MRC0_9HYPO|nr:hypothetical protein FIE12Z_5633 [Fusarium flagelliforme]